MQQATTSLLLKSGLLSWIEMQLLDPTESEGIAWLKVIENIICIVDPAKIESSTSGDWRSVLARCLSSVLKHWKSCTSRAVESPDV